MNFVTWSRESFLLSTLLKLSQNEWKLSGFPSNFSNSNLGSLAKFWETSETGFGAIYLTSGVKTGSFCRRNSESSNYIALIYLENSPVVSISWNISSSLSINLVILSSKNLTELNFSSNVTFSESITNLLKTFLVFQRNFSFTNEFLIYALLALRLRFVVVHCTLVHS